MAFNLFKTQPDFGKNSIEYHLYGIAYGCPRMVRKKDCPLLEIEHLSFKEKVNWINKLNEKKGNAILMYRTNCTEK